MAALKELKERIASVQSTLKITSAMKMVASAKLMKVQSSMVALSEYERRFSDIVAALVSDPDVEVASPLTLEHGEKRQLALRSLQCECPARGRRGCGGTARRGILPGYGVSDRGEDGAGDGPVCRRTRGEAA